MRLVLKGECPMTAHPRPSHGSPSAKRRAIAKAEFDKVITPEVLEDAEKMHKRLSRVSHEELNREFTI